MLREMKKRCSRNYEIFNALMICLFMMINKLSKKAFQ